MLPPVKARHPGTSAQLRAQLARLRSVFTGQEPEAVRTGLAPINDGQVMVTGTTLPPLRTPFVRRPSGLLVPAAAVPQPMDDTVCWISAEELFGAAPSEALTRDWLQELSFADVLGFVAASLRAYRDPWTDVRQTDLDFAELHLANEALLRARNLLRDPSRRLVVPQALYALVMLGARDCGTTGSPDAESQMLVLTYFGALQLLDEATDHFDEGDDEMVVDTAVGELSQFALINQYFNRPGDEVHLMARLVRQWLELPREQAGAPGVVDLEREFATATGTSLGDVTITAILLWTSTLQGLSQVRLDYFAALRWTDERLRAALAVYTADLPTLGRALRSDLDAHGPVWDFSSLERYPVVHLDDGSLLVLDVRLLVRRIFGGLLAFDVTESLEARGGNGVKAAARVKAYLQHLGEAYALEVLHSLVASGPSCPRVFDEAVLLSAYRQRGRRIADAAVDYGDAWVVVEITTSRLTRASVAGSSVQALSRDLDKLVGKVEQLDHTIAALRDDPTRLTGSPTGPARRFFPLLVVAEGFPVNPVSVELLRNRVRQRGLLTAADIAPLEVVDTVELEMLEGLAESGGPGLRDVLAGKEHATLFRNSVRAYLTRECRYNFSRSRRLAGLVDKAWKPAREALPPQALGVHVKVAGDDASTDALRSRE